MDVAKEMRALKALSELLSQADGVKVLFDEAAMEYPAPLKRILGEGFEMIGNASNGHARARINPPSTPSRPAGIADAWIYVPLAALTPQTFTLGLLRAAQVHMPMKTVVSMLREHDPEVNSGSIANIGTRLEAQGTIERTKAGWRLLDASKAPVLNGRYAWGDTEAFTRQELAARRRELLLHVLRHFRDGLQQTQLLTQLEGCAWLKTPLSIDLLKADMQELEEIGKVRRGALKKWVVVDEASSR